MARHKAVTHAHTWSFPRLRTMVAGVAALSTIGVVGVTLAPGASADTSQTRARSEFITGTLAGLGILDPAVANNLDTGALVRTHAPLLTIPAPGLLDLGAANQLALADVDGVSKAVTGAVSDGGDTYPADMALDAGTLLAGTPLQTALSQLRLELGAISSAVGIDASNPDRLASSCDDLTNPDHCRGYDIAGGELHLRSPLIGDVVGQLLGALAPVSDAVNALTGPTGELARAIEGIGSITSALGVADLDVNATVQLDLETAVRNALRDPLDDGIVRIELATGAISVDLDTLVEATTGTALNKQAPNTEILSAPVLTELVTRITTLLGRLPGQVLDVVETTLNGAAVDVSANLCVLSEGEAPDCVIPGIPPLPDLPGTGLDLSVVGTLGAILSGGGTAAATVQLPLVPDLVIPTNDLLAAVNGALTGVTDALENSVTPAVNTLVTDLLADLEPALAAINQVVSLVVNLQDNAFLDDQTSARVTAARLTLLNVAGTDGGVATVDLARSEVAARIVPDGDPTVPDPVDPDPVNPTDPDPVTPTDPDPATPVDPAPSVPGTDQQPQPGPAPAPIQSPADLPTRITAGG